MMRRALRCAGIAAVTLLASNAAAEDRLAGSPVRVIVLGRPNASALARMRAELESLGWQVFAPRSRSDTSDGSAPSRRELEDTAREFHATAIVEIDDEAALHVWIIDDAGHVKPVEVLRTPAEDVTALRSAEVVRVALEYRLHSPDGAAPPLARSAPDTGTRSTGEPTAPRARKFTVGVGVSILAIPYASMSPGWNVRLDARYELKPTIGLTAFFSAPVSPSIWKGGGTWTDIRVWLAGVGPVFMWHSKLDVWTVRAGGGIAGAVIGFGGEGIALGQHGARGEGPAVLPFVQLEVGLQIVPGFRWNGGILVGHALPRAGVSSAEGTNDTAVWGQPLTMFSTTLDASF